jgi:hypothetical protein
LRSLPPLRDRGVDLIAYVDIDEDIDNFVGIPIQLKAASKRSFGIHRKYDKFLNMIITFVWDLASTEELPSIYALTQQEAVAVADAMGYTQTESWQTWGGYDTTSPSKKLIEYLKPYRMTSRGIHGAKGYYLWKHNKVAGRLRLF